MLGTIKLNTIKNRINDFELKSCVYIAPIDTDDRKSFSPYYYCNNKASFYILCSNKRRSTYNTNSYSPFNRKAIKNILFDACIFPGNNTDICDLDLERFLVMQKNDDFLGWYTSNELIDKNINLIRGNKYCKHYKDNIYYGNNVYDVDISKLHLFVRIVPKDCNSLTNLIINCTRDCIYNISERGNVDKVGTLGFIVKLDNRYEYVYNNVCEKITRIKYPFLIKDRINKLLFDEYEGIFNINKEIIYIKDNTKLDKYGIKVLDNF